jgi:hypothetical protein
MGRFYRGGAEGLKRGESAQGCEQDQADPGDQRNHENGWKVVSESPKDERKRKQASDGGERDDREMEFLRDWLAVFHENDAFVGIVSVKCDEGFRAVEIENGSAGEAPKREKESDDADEVGMLKFSEQPNTAKEESDPAGALKCEPREVIERVHGFWSGSQKNAPECGAF